MGFSLDSPAWKNLQGTANRVIDREAKDGLDALSDEERIFFLVWIADSEVENGGMHAVCYNSTGNYLSRFPEAFRAIGAPQKAEAFERLIQAFGPPGPSSEHSARLRQHENLREEAAARIDMLDDYYFHSTESVQDLLYKWSASWTKATST